MIHFNVAIRCYGCFCLLIYWHFPYFFRIVGKTLNESMRSFSLVSQDKHMFLIENSYLFVLFFLFLLSLSLPFSSPFTFFWTFLFHVSFLPYWVFRPPTESCCWLVGPRFDSASWMCHCEIRCSNDGFSKWQRHSINNPSNNAQLVSMYHSIQRTLSVFDG